MQYRADVSSKLSQRGFNVELFEDSLGARMTTVGDAYHIEIRNLSALENETVVEIDATGTPF